MENKRPTPLASTAAGQPPYPYSYPYPPPPPQAYPGYSPAYPSHPVGDAPATEEETGEGSDAWEAAQNILKAINFGALIQFQESEKDAGEAGSGPVNDIIAQGECRHPSPVVANSNIDVTTMGAGPSQAVETSAATIPVQLNADDRAALQAQLALLAAQMAEFAEGEEDTITLELGAPTTTKVNETKAVDDGNTIAEMDQEDDKEDDDDMERVDVP